MRNAFSQLYEAEQFVIDKTGVKTLEIINASFVANGHSIYGKVDDEYLKKEIAWYLTEKQNIQAMDPPVPALWSSTAGVDGETNSNYGFLVFSPQNHHQYKNVLVELAANKFSRRAIMIYTRPEMWWMYSDYGKNDFVCTNNVQYLIRNNKLETLVYMRSNDAVFGYKCDRHWQMYVRDKLHRDLLKHYPDLKRGYIYWNVGSLHIYERHFYLVDYYIKTGIYDVIKSEYDKEVG
jgi:thymidylate synthase